MTSGLFAWLGVETIAGMSDPHALILIFIGWLGIGASVGLVNGLILRWVLRRPAVPPQRPAVLTTPQAVEYALGETEIARKPSSG